MAEPIEIVVSEFSLKRSWTPGVLPPSLKDGEQFAQMADGYWIIGNGITAPSDLTRMPLLSEEGLLRPGSPINKALEVQSAAILAVLLPAIVDALKKLPTSPAGLSVGDLYWNGGFLNRVESL